MDADPDAVEFVGEDVDIVITRANRPQLLACHLLERGGGIQTPGVIIEEGMIDLFVVTPTDAEGHGLEDLLHDVSHAVTDVAVVEIKPYRLVAAANVIANAGGGHVVLVGE